MTSNLIPTTITDVNGRVTTVHKKPETGTSAPQRLANVAPVLPSGQAAEKPAETPLPDYGTATAEDMKEMSKNYPSMTYTRDDGKNVLTTLTSLAPPRSLGLVREALETGVPEDVVERLVYTFGQRTTSWWSDQEDGKEHAITHLDNSLLVASHIQREYPELQYWNPEEQARFIHRGLEAYTIAPEHGESPHLEPFTTVEDVDRAAAVVCFMTNALHNHGGLMGTFIRNISFVDAARVSRFGTIITNRELDSYVRSRPQEIRRIISYMGDERNEYDNTDEDVQNLIQFLEETADIPTLSDGWL